MAIYTAQVTVSTTATLLTTGSGGGRCWTFANRGASPVYVGDSTVSTTTGFMLRPLADGASSSDPVMLEIEVRPGELVFAVTSTGSVRVDVFSL